MPDIHFIGPSTLLSTILHGWMEASWGLASGAVTASLTPSSSYIVTTKPAWRVKSRRWKWQISDLRIMCGVSAIIGSRAFLLIGTLDARDCRVFRVSRNEKF